MRAWIDGRRAAYGPPVSRCGLQRGVAVVERVRFQPLPVEPCVRFSRSRLTDVVHQVAFGFSRQGLLALGATTIPSRCAMPMQSDEACTTWCQP